MELALYEAVKFDHLQRVKELLMGIPAPNINWQNTNFNGCPAALHVVCEKAFTQTLTLLLLHPNIDVNLGDATKRTGFYIASTFNQTEVISVLLKDLRVDVNQPDVSGKTPLWAAAYHGFLAVIQWMVASGREIDWTRPGLLKAEQRMCTPLEIAVLRRHGEVERLLRDIMENPPEVSRNMRRTLGVEGWLDFRCV